MPVLKKGKARTTLETLDVSRSIRDVEEKTREYAESQVPRVKTYTSPYGGNTVSIDERERIYTPHASNNILQTADTNGGLQAINYNPVLEQGAANIAAKGLSTDEQLANYAKLLLSSTGRTTAQTMGVEKLKNTINNTWKIADLSAVVNDEKDARQFLKDAQKYYEASTDDYEKSLIQKGIASYTKQAARKYRGIADSLSQDAETYSAIANAVKDTREKYVYNATEGDFDAFFNDKEKYYKWYNDEWQKLNDAGDYDGLARLETAPRDYYNEQKAGVLAGSPTVDTSAYDKLISDAEAAYDIAKASADDSSAYWELYDKLDAGTLTDRAKKSAEYSDTSKDKYIMLETDITAQAFNNAYSAYTGISASQLGIDNSSAIHTLDSTGGIEDYLTDEQKGIIRYLYNNGGQSAVNDYMRFIYDDVYGRRMETETQAAYAQGASDKWYTNMGTQVLNTLEKISYSLESTIEAVAGDKYGNALTRQSAASAYQSGAASTMPEFGSFMYNVYASMLQSLAVMPMGGVGTVSLGATALSDRYNEKIASGASQGEALAYAIVDGVAETISEYVSLEHLFKLPELSGTTFQKLKQGLTNVLTQSFTEGSEEVASDLINFLYDRVAHDTDGEFAKAVYEYQKKGYSETDAENQAYLDLLKSTCSSFLAGAVSGGIMAGGASALGAAGNATIGNYGYYSSIGSDVRASNNAAYIADEYRKLNGKEQTGKATRSDYRLGKQYSKVKDSASAEMETAANEYEDAYSALKSWRKAATEYNAKSETEAEAARAAYSAKAETAKTELNEAKEKADRSTLKFLNVAAATKTEINVPRAAQEIAAEATEAAGNMKIAGVSGASETASNISSIASVGTDATVNVKRDGKTVSVPVSEAVYSSEEQAKAVAIAAKMPSQGVANVFLDAVKAGRAKSDVSNVAAGMIYAYSMGKGGYSSFDDISSSNYVRKAQSNELLKTAFDLGSGDLNALISERNAQYAENVKNALGKAWKGGTVDTGAIENIQLNKYQQASIRVLQYVAGTTGINVRLFASKANGEGRYSGKNGEYNPTTNTMEIDINAGRNNISDSIEKSAMLTVAAHEMTHSLQKNAIEQYNALKKAVLDVLAKQSGKSIDALVAEITDKYAQSNIKLLPDAAIDELVARVCESMFRDSSIAEAMNELHPEAARTIWEKIKDALVKIRNAINAAFGREATENKYLMQVKQDIDGYIDICDKWIDALKQAARNTYSYVENAVGTEAVKAVSSENAEMPEGAKEGSFAIEYDASEDTRYSVRDFAEQIDELREGKFPKDDHLYVMNTTEEMKLVGLNDLPILMTQKHAKSVMKETGSDDANYHGLGRNGIIQLPEAIKNCAMIIKSHKFDNRITIITNTFNKQRERIIAPIEIDGSGNWGGKELSANILTSAYGKARIKDIIVQAVLNNEVLYVDKKRADTLSKTLGLQLPNNLRGGGFIHSIRDFSDNVNTKEENLHSDNAQFSLRDSEGNALSLAQQEYFKDSKVRDEDGNLLIVYRGSDADFTVFDREKGRTNMDIQGSFFGPWEIDAEEYGGNVRAFYLNIKNPASERAAYAALNRFKGQNGAGVKAREYLESMGYDGVNNENEEYIAFNPEQIKSISNENPTSDPDIRFMPRDTEDVSPRELLMNALEESATEEELKQLNKYRAKMGTITELEGKIADVRARTARIYKDAGGRNNVDADGRKAVAELTVERKALQEQLDGLDRELLKIETLKPVRNILNRERRRYLSDIGRLKKSVERQKELRKLDKKRESIKKMAAMLKDPIESKFLPDGLRDAFRKTVNVYYEAKNKAVFTKQMFDDLYTEYKKLSDESNSLYMYYSEDIANAIEGLKGYADGKRFTQLDYEHTRDLADILQHLNKIAREDAAIFRGDRRIRVEDAANEVAAALEGKGARRENLLNTNAIEKWLTSNNITAPYMFKHLGTILGELGNDIAIKANAKYGLLVKKAASEMQKIEGKYNLKEWLKQKPLTLTTEGGANIELTVGEAMGIYATAKREAGDITNTTHHLRDGGVITKRGALDLFRRRESVSSAIKITENDIARIENFLSDEQKSYVDEMVKHITSYAELGNETSNQLWGYSAFGDIEYYYPFKTSSDFRPMRVGDAETALIKNMGFTKRVVKNAHNPVVITDFTQTISEHINQMITYCAFAVAQDNFMRVYNYNFKDSESGTSRTLKLSLKAVYGEKMTEYIRVFMNDLYGVSQKSVNEAISDRMIGAFKKGAVAASLSTAIQQPSAIARAFAMISPKYFMGAQKLNPLSAFNEAMEYAGTAVLKDMGRFDTGMGKNSAQYIMGSGARTAGKKTRDAIDKVTGWLPEAADKLTWGLIWEACKRETADINGLAKNSEENKKLAGERFDEVISYTQVFDATTVKSQAMRDKSTYMKMLTSFMAEPTLTYNMLMDAVLDARKGNGVSASRKVGTVVGATVFNAALAAVVYAMRDDDDEKATYAERYIKNFISGIDPVQNLLEMIPLAQDAYNIFRGYDIKRTDAQVLSDIYAYFKTMTNGEKTDMERIRSLASLIGVITGVPVKNVWREVDGVLNTIDSIGNETRRNANYMAVMKGLQDWAWLEKAGLDMSGKAFATNYADALISGNRADANEAYLMLTEYYGRDYDAIDTAVKSILKEKYLGGEIDEKRAYSLLTDGSELTPNEAKTLVDSEWKYELDTGRRYSELDKDWKEKNISDAEYANARTKYGGDSAESVAKALGKLKFERDYGVKYDDVDALYINGRKGYTRDAVKRIYRDYGLMTEDEAEKAVLKLDYEKDHKPLKYSNMKEDWGNGLIKDSEAIQYLRKYGGLTEQKAWEQVDKWKYAKANGDDASYSQFHAVTDALDSRKDAKSAITEFYAHHEYKTAQSAANAVASRITEWAKPLYIAASENERASMEDYLLECYRYVYELAGVEYYGDKKKLKTIRGWLDTE